MSPRYLEQSKETEADESSSNRDRIFPKLGEMLTGVSINKALIRKKQQPLCGLGGAWGENTNSKKHAHLQSWRRITKGPASQWLLQSPLFPHTVTVQWTHRLALSTHHPLARMLVRLPTWVCTAAGLWDFTVINSSRGSSPPSELEKMEGKEWEQKSAEKSEKEKRTTLRWEEEREWPAGGISASWGSLMGSCISDRSPTFSHSTALSFSSPWRIIKTDDTDAVPSGTTALDCRAICTIIYRPPPNSPPSPCPPL